jgi:hypothetical protein
VRVGWRDRDYARWTDEERRRFLGSSVPSSSRPRIGSPLPSSPRPRIGSRVPSSQPRLFGSSRVGVAQGASLAIIVSAVLFLLGHVPYSHPLIPALHFTVPRPPFLTQASSTTATLGKISVPRSARLGSFLTLHGQLPSGESGTVSVDGAYRRPPWQLLAAVPAQDGFYTARIHLSRTGLLHLRITHPDGHRSVGSIRVVR